MKNRFQVYDVVYERLDPNDNTPFDWDNEAIFIIVDIIKNNTNNDDFSDDTLTYDIRYVFQDNGSGVPSKYPKYSNGEFLRKYEGDDEEVLFFTNDAKEIYKIRLEDEKLKVEYHINYKFKVKDILVLKNDIFERKRYFVVEKLVEDTFYLNVLKNKLMSKKCYYAMDELWEMNGEVISVHSAGEISEDDLELYTGNDERVFKAVEEHFRNVVFDY